MAKKAEERIAREATAKVLQQIKSESANQTGQPAGKQPNPRKLGRSTIEAYLLFIATGVYAVMTAFGIPVNFWAGGLILVGIAYCAIDLLWHSPATINLHIASKCGGLIVILLVIAITMHSGYVRTHRPETTNETLLGAIIDLGQKVQSAIEASRTQDNGWVTGGDFYCYFMLYWFDLDKSIAKSEAIIRDGKYPLYDVGVDIVDRDTQKRVHQYIGEISGGGSHRALNYDVAWHLADSMYYSMEFSARNGIWHQDLQLKKSTKVNYWLAATRVRAGDGEIIFQHVDNEWSAEFGNPVWR
jgi:hypothetical protein